MGKSIGEIREELNNTSLEEIPFFLSSYREDSRAGVQALLQRARNTLEKLEIEKKRIYQMTAFERKYQEYGYQAICGIDEVGRGPLAGPVVAAAVVLPANCQILYVNDSKQLSAKKREKLYDVIMDQAVSVGFGYASHERIDEINILQATYEAMRQAVGALSVAPDLLLNDAVKIPQLTMKQVPIVKGDAKSLSIAAASIVAKVTRDRMMVEYDSLFPEYDFAGNKGYGSAKHIAALREYGPCPIHRSSFIKNLLEES